MSAFMSWVCDICGKTQMQDVTDDAASDCRVRTGYPLGWYVGDEKAACESTACTAEVMRSDHDVPDDGPGRDTV